MITLSTLMEQTAQLSLSGFKESLLFQSEDTKYQQFSKLYIWVFARTKILYDKFSKPIRTIGTHTDITSHP
jgi:hypothetical protein